MSKYIVKLKIADFVIKLESDFPAEQFIKGYQSFDLPTRFENFLYNGNGGADIKIKINLVNKLPKIKDTRDIFITYHFQDNRENWRLMRKGKYYIYKSHLKSKKQFMLINRTFDRITAYLLPKNDKSCVWSIGDIIYDFLQVLLINYFALHKKGIFVHSIGVKDVNGKGLIFVGKSGSGKSTTARLWHKHSKAMVLNDDRIIVRKLNGSFFIYSSPWHGEFDNYIVSKINSAPLNKLFFIYHSSHNTVRRISEKEAFNLFYPAIFPTFWDRKCLENIVSFSQDLVKNAPCYNLGFVKDRKIISFVRKI